MLFLFSFFIIFNYPGNVYITDTYNHRVRKVTISTGIITTLAGTGSTTFSGDNGPAASSTLYNPWGIAVDSAGISWVTNTFSLASFTNFLLIRQRVYW